MSRPQRSFRFTPVDDRKTAELSDALSLSKTEVVRLGIAELHSKTFPPPMGYRMGYRVWSVQQQAWMHDLTGDPQIAEDTARMAFEDGTVGEGDTLQVWAVEGLSAEIDKPYEEYTAESFR